MFMVRVVIVYQTDISDKQSSGFLNIYEIENLVNALSDLGVSKIRVTGGEPTVRKSASNEC